MKEHEDQDTKYRNLKRRNKRTGRQIRGRIWRVGGQIPTKNRDKDIYKDEQKDQTNRREEERETNRDKCILAGLAAQRDKGQSEKTFLQF